MICLGILLVVVIGGAVGGGIKGKEYIENRVVETQTVTAPGPSPTASR